MEIYIYIKKKNLEHEMKFFSIRYKFCGRKKSASKVESKFNVA